MILQNKCNKSGSTIAEELKRIGENSKFLHSKKFKFFRIQIGRLLTIVRVSCGRFSHVKIHSHIELKLYLVIHVKKFF